MKRPTAHVVEDKSRQILDAAIPDTWIKRRLPEDYGVDYEIEIVDSTVVTGKRLWIQLKATGNLRRSDRLPWMVTRDLRPTDRVPHAVHRLPTALIDYALRCDFPLLLMVVDLRSQDILWLPLREYADGVLDAVRPSWRGQSSVSVYIDADANVAKDVSEGAPSLRWYALDPGRRSALGLLASFSHELGYEAQLSGYCIGDGHLEGRENLLFENVQVARHYLSRALDLDLLFGQHGVDYFVDFVAPIIRNGIVACDELLHDLPVRRIEFRHTSGQIGTVHHALSMLSSVVALYQGRQSPLLLRPHSAKGTDPTIARLRV